MNKDIKTFYLPYPISNNCYYRNYNGIMVLSKKGRDYKKAVRMKYSQIEPFKENVSVFIFIHARMTKDGIAFKKCIDMDNAFKCVLDSLNNIAYIDDKQVRKIMSDEGYPTKNGGVTVIVMKKNYIYANIEYKKGNAYEKINYE